MIGRTKKIEERTWLLIIVGVVLITRLVLAFGVNNFSVDESYFNMRQIENIMETGKPVFQDELSYGGRIFSFSPVFHYLIAIVGVITGPMFAGKIVPAILATSLIPIVHSITKRLTKHKTSALLAAGVAGFIPIYFSDIIFSISIYSLAIPLSFLAIHFFLKIKESKTNAYYFIITTSLLIITHSLSIVLIGSLLLFTGLARIEGMKKHKEEREALLFLSFLAIWFYLVAYKQGILMHGTSIIWQNVPTSIINDYFSNTNILRMLSQIGSIPFLFGMYVVYTSTFGQKNRSLLVVISMTLVTFLTLWLKLIQPEPGLMTLGVLMAILFGVFYKYFSWYINKIKLQKTGKWMTSIFLSITIISLIIPSITYSFEQRNEVMKENEIKALEWLKKNTASDSRILASVEEGHAITAVAKRKNVADTHFLLIKNTDVIVEDIDTLFTSSLTTTTVPLLQKHAVDFIYYSKRTEKKYQTEEAFSDHRCFRQVYGNSEVKIIEPTCSKIRRFR